MEWTCPVDREREQLENHGWVLLSFQVLLYLIHVFPLRPVDQVTPVLPLEPERIVEEYHVLVDMYPWPKFLWDYHRPVSNAVNRPNQLLINKDQLFELENLPETLLVSPVTKEIKIMHLPVVQSESLNQVPRFKRAPSVRCCLRRIFHFEIPISGPSNFA